MPSVFVLSGPEMPRCRWMISRGAKDRRKFEGCFETFQEAEQAAYEAGKGWTPVASRPPGVPLSKRPRRRSRQRRGSLWCLYRNGKRSTCSLSKTHLEELRAFYREESPKHRWTIKRSR